METYQIINLADWQQVGEGGNGKTYVNPAAPGEILKVNNARLSTLEAVKHEYDVSKAVESLGLSVPQIHHIVHVGDAYATFSLSLLSGSAVLNLPLPGRDNRLTISIGLILINKSSHLVGNPWIHQS